MTEVDGWGGGKHVLTQLFPLICHFMIYFDSFLHLFDLNYLHKCIFIFILMLFHDILPCPGMDRGKCVNSQ